MSFDIGLGL